MRFFVLAGFGKNRLQNHSTAEMTDLGQKSKTFRT
jgi:hypothetical protein